MKTEGEHSVNLEDIVAVESFDNELHRGLVNFLTENGISILPYSIFSHEVEYKVPGILLNDIADYNEIVKRYCVTFSIRFNDIDKISLAKYFLFKDILDYCEDQIRIANKPGGVVFRRSLELKSHSEFEYDVLGSSNSRELIEDGLYKEAIQRVSDYLRKKSTEVMEYTLSTRFLIGFDEQFIVR